MLFIQKIVDFCKNCDMLMKVKPRRESASDMEQMKILAPCGILGYGFPKESFLRGIEQKPDAIVVDAGSTDAGPHKLGKGVAIVSNTAMFKDLELIITHGYHLGIPMVIGSAGGAGGKIHVERTLNVIYDIIQKHNLQDLDTAVVWGDIDKDLVRSKLEQGKVHPLGNTVKPLTDQRLDETNAIVAQMGHEPILKALQGGAKMVVCGRAYDPSPFAAVTAYYGFSLDYGYHMGKILECAALCAVPGTTKDCMMGTVDKEGFVVEPLSDQRRCTKLSVAAHTFYEKEHPYILHGPGVVMNLEQCRFLQLTDRSVRAENSRCLPAPVYQVKLEGARQAAYRTFVIAGVRDPLMIQQLPQIENEAVEQVARYYSDVSREDYQINFFNYGINGVLGDLDPVQTLPHEVGLLFEVVAKTQEMADMLCATLRSTILHFGYEGRKSTAGNLAFPFAPSDVSFGPVYEFSVYHLMDLDPEEICGLFPVERLDWRTYEKREIV